MNIPEGTIPLRVFETGAVRDAVDGKGRCDLLPLDVIGDYLNIPELRFLDGFVREGNVVYLDQAINTFIHASVYTSKVEAVLDVAKHYEDGAKHYPERNWEKGIHPEVYIDSGVRHLLKYYDGRTDEPHGRAFLWNMFGLIWTIRNLDLPTSLPFATKEVAK